MSNNNLSYVAVDHYLLRRYASVNSSYSSNHIHGSHGLDEHGGAAHLMDMVGWCLVLVISHWMVGVKKRGNPWIGTHLLNFLLMKM